MSWLVWVMAVPVVLIVAGAVVRERLVNGSWPDELGLLFGCLLFGSSLLGFFVTSLATPTLRTWWQAPLLRTLWQIGGGLVLALAVVLTAGGIRRPLSRVHFWAAALVGVGALMSANAWLDLLAGPVVLRGVADVNVERSHGRGAKIWANFEGRAPDGSTHRVDLTGWTANDALERLSVCEGASKVDVTVLIHLDRVLEVRCR